VTEEDRNTPYGGKRYQRVDHSANRGGLSAEEPCNDVKLENTDASPVQTSDDGKYQSYSVDDRIKPSFTGLYACNLPDVLYPLHSRLFISKDSEKNGGKSV